MYRIVIQCRPKEWLVTVQIGKQLGFHSSPIKQRVEECILLSFFLVGFFLSLLYIARPKGLACLSLISFALGYSFDLKVSVILFYRSETSFFAGSVLCKEPNYYLFKRSLTIRSFTIIASCFNKHSVLDLKVSLVFSYSFTIVQS